ncbi:MAG TPA: cytochrome P450 [Solirubrobacteraceae bacterium]
MPDATYGAQLETEFAQSGAEHLAAEAAHVDVEHADVLIVGAGLSGIGAACHLRRNCPGKSLAILEAREAIGGTWDLFRYPGIRSDSDMFTLGYSFKPWQQEQSIADGASILEYVQQTAREHGVERQVRFGHRVLRASWSSAQARWTVEAQRGEQGEIVRFTCGFLYNCTGYYRYDEGYAPRFPGIERFAGRVVHPQHWPEDLDWDGQRVVVIGSGATAVTLVPALAKRAAHVTMLQRSPTYILSLPSRDPLARVLQGRLPAQTAYSIVRWKNVLLATLNYQLCKRAPQRMSKLFRRFAEKQLPAGFDVDTHLKPSYDPWDQRLCLVPDGDLFRTISKGDASIATDQIETFTETGIELASGETLDADLVISATGLNLLTLGGIELAVDGERIELANTVAYKGMMLCGVPNLALTLGYTNASWTLKADLVAEYVCRVLKHMDAEGATICTPLAPDPALPTEPIIDLKSGYVKRSIDTLPRQGAMAPWRLHQNYVKDVRLLKRGPVDDAMAFSTHPEADSDAVTQPGVGTQPAATQPGAGTQPAATQAGAGTQPAATQAGAGAQAGEPQPIEGLPPGPRVPVGLQTLAMGTRQRPFLERARRRYGSMFTIKVPGLGHAVVVSDPALIKQAFRADPKVLHAGTGSPLRVLLGSNSLLGIDEDQHMQQRKLLLPPFKGQRMRGYESLIAEIAAAEIDSWPEEVEFETAKPLQRITLRAILRAVFGAEGASLASLEELLPAWTELATKLVLAPWLQRNLGPRSRWARFQVLRAEIDAILDGLIAAAKADPQLEQRPDVLALMVQAHHEDGSSMSNPEIRDQLITMLVAGHETTANSLSWAVERLRRHPDVLARLVEEVDAGGKELREASIREVQRTRPVIAFAGRIVRKRFVLGGYSLPLGTRVLLAACLTHYDPKLFGHPERFDPDRFLDTAPGTYEWIPFGGGIRRCIGASFAHMEMDVVLRVLLERVELLPTDAPGEPWAFRGIVWAAGEGGKVSVRKRGLEQRSDELLSLAHA